MAAATSESNNNSEESSEIEEIRAAFIGRCRIINDIGDYKQTITIQPKNQDVTIKFQLRATYPSIIPDIAVRSSSLKNEHSLELRTRLTNKAKELIGAPMIGKLMQTAEKNLQSLGLKPGKVGEVESHTIIDDNSNVKKNTRKKKRTPKSEDEIEEEKKKPMKTADDVIKRILWDESLEKDDFIVGYIDRFRGLVEKYFSLFSWEDLACVDYDVLAVPRHRIQYFKYKTVKVWDKTHRVDNVFGSARGTKTIDVVIKELEELEGRHLGEVHSPEQALDNESLSEDSEEEEDSDDDDNIQVTIGASANIGIKPNQASAGCKESHNANDEDSYNPYWQDKLRPNYFICVPITDPMIIDHIGEVGDHLTEKEPLFSECCIPRASLHVTICTLGLDTSEQLLHCMTSLNKVKDEIKSALPKSVLKFHGVSHFYNRVLYAKVNYQDDFIDFCNVIKLSLLEAGIEIRDGYDFVPHMTIIKTTRPVSRLRGSKNIDPDLYAPFLDKQFGQQKIDRICLCSMARDRREDGFYMTPLEFTFK